LEEIVGGRLHCAFYRWTQRYQKCIEEGESMNFDYSSQMNASNDDNNDSTESSVLFKFFTYEHLI
jgi:hypothetical protein